MEHLKNGSNNSSIVKDRILDISSSSLETTASTASSAVTDKKMKRFLKPEAEGLTTRCRRSAVAFAFEAEPTALIDFALGRSEEGSRSKRDEPRSRRTNVRFNPMKHKKTPPEAEVMKSSVVKESLPRLFERRNASAVLAMMSNDSNNIKNVREASGLSSAQDTCENSAACSLDDSTRQVLDSAHEDISEMTESGDEEFSRV